MITSMLEPIPIAAKCYQSSHHEFRLASHVSHVGADFALELYRALVPVLP